MRVLECVVGVSLIVVSGMNAIRQLVMLARRYRSTSVWQLVSLPAAGIFRVALLLIAQGFFLLETDGSAGWWATIGLWSAILTWHCGIWLRACLQRRRPRTAS
jgi:hypothetical protein